MITKRLSALADWIEEDVLADIGCDHAYLACQAAIDNKVKKAYACDIRQMPLERARQTIETYQVQDKVQCILMDGISCLPEDVNCIVLAGMGASTIRDILQESLLREGMQLLVSPHKDVSDCRKDLMDKHIEIIKERVVYDQGHYYPILNCRYHKQKHLDYSERDLLLGVNMVKDETYRAFIRYQTQKLQRILAKVTDPDNHPFTKQYRLLKEEGEMLQDIQS